MSRRRSLRVVVRFRAARSRLRNFVGGSLAVHGVLLAVILIVPTARHSVAPIEDSVVVALAGPIGGAQAAAPKTTAPSPPPASKAAAPPAPKEAHVVRDIPTPKPKDKPDKKKDLAKPAEPPVAKPDASQSAAPGTPSPSPAGPGAPGAATGVTASLGSGDSTLGWYGAAVKAALESAWVKPYLEDQGQTYSVIIAFDIARDGTTRNVRIVQPSGVPSLDRSAQRAVIEASPLPAVPQTWKDDTLPATMRFDLNPETP